MIRTVTATRYVAPLREGGSLSAMVEADDDGLYVAIPRVVPHVERGECINAGLLLWCRTRRFLGARVHLDEARLRALAPDRDPAGVRSQLEAIVHTGQTDDRAAGAPEAASTRRAA